MMYLYYYYAFIFMPDIENSGLTHIPTTLTFVVYRILLAVAVGQSAKVRETAAGTVWAVCTLLLGPLAAVIFIIGALYTYAASF